MPKYRRRPVVIEAEEFWPEQKPWPAGVEERDGTYMIDTLEGPHLVTPGDFIITGVKGERYACKPDIFAMTYEPVDDSSV